MRVVPGVLEVRGAVVKGSEMMQGFEHRLHEIEIALTGQYASHEGPEFGIVSGDGHLSTFSLVEFRGGILGTLECPGVLDDIGKSGAFAAAPQSILRRYIIT